MNQELFDFQTYGKDADREWPEDIEAPFPVVPVFEPWAVAIPTELRRYWHLPCGLMFNYLVHTLLGKEPQAIEDSRGLKYAKIARQNYIGHHFEHLVHSQHFTHSELDWSFPGWYICCVVNCDYCSTVLRLPINCIYT